MLIDGVTAYSPVVLRFHPSEQNRVNMCAEWGDFHKEANRYLKYC